MNTSMKNALEWYQEQAEAAARHSIQVNTEALMAIVQALALDAGSRAKTALTANADLLTERDNLASIVATGIDDVAGAALDDAEETINDLRAQIDALTAVPANAEPVALVDRIEDLIAEFGEKSLPMIGEAIGRWRQAAPASAEPVKDKVIAVADLIYSVNPQKDSDPETGEEWYVPFETVQTDYPATMEQLLERAGEVIALASADYVEALKNLRQTIIEDKIAVTDTLWMPDSIIMGCTAVDYIDLTLTIDT
jgi:hypothetical protein